MHYNRLIGGEIYEIKVSGLHTFGGVYVFSQINFVTMHERTDTTINSPGSFLFCKSSSIDECGGFVVTVISMEPLVLSHNAFSSVFNIDMEKQDEDSEDVIKRRLKIYTGV